MKARSTFRFLVSLLLFAVVSNLARVDEARAQTKHAEVPIANAPLHPDISNPALGFVI
jgi:hypothetical protein